MTVSGAGVGTAGVVAMGKMQMRTRNTILKTQTEMKMMMDTHVNSAHMRNYKILKF